MTTSTDLSIYEPRNLAELRDFAEEVVKTELVPKGYKDKPKDAMVAMMYGKETAGLGPLTSLQYVAVINGRPAFYSDALPGIAFSKKLITDMEEFFEGTPYEDDFKAVCIVTRPNGRKVRQEFSVADAKRAGLWDDRARVRRTGKNGAPYETDNDSPWYRYPKRMLQWRARGWAIRDAAPHALFGPTVEDLSDQPHIGPENAKEINPREPEPAKPEQPLSAPELVEVYDADGVEYLLPPGEVEQWMRDKIAGATDDELQALAANNQSERAHALIKAERDARAAAREQERRAPAEQPKRTAKEVAEAIAARFEAARNMDELLAAEGETRADMARLPLSAKETLARIFHRRREALEQPAEPPDERQPSMV